MNLRINLLWALKSGCLSSNSSMILNLSELQFLLSKNDITCRLHGRCSINATVYWAYSTCIIITHEKQRKAFFGGNHKAPTTIFWNSYSNFSHHLGKHSGICRPTQSSWLPRGFELQLRESPQLGSIRNHHPLPSTVFVTPLLRMTLRASPIQPGSWYFNSRKADTGKEQMNCLRH